MKKIKIFLASSLTEFAIERMEIENFIRNVSDEFEEKYNIKLQPYLCENIDSVYTLGRKQEEYNNIIRDCDFCFFIFFTKAGEYTREEFEVAREQFEATGKPKIYTYFKVVEEGQAEQNLRDFLNKLDKELGHFYSTFSHIDTVKLRILLSIKLQEMDFLEIKAEDGHCVVDGQKVLPLTNVAEFANNQQLAAIQRELAELEKEYFSLKAQYHNRMSDTEFYHHYSQIASRRQTMMDEIAELQGLIFNMSLQMAKDDTHGDISPRQKKAYQLFEQGDYEGCMSVLDAADIDHDFLTQRQRIQEQARKQEEAVCRKYIREHKTAIDILMTMKKYEGRFVEIEERYEKIIPIICEMNIELETALTYVLLLRNQHKNRKALHIAEQLADRFNDDEENKAYLLSSLGSLYRRQKFYSRAEECFLQAVHISQKLAQINPKKHSILLVTSYLDVGGFYLARRKAYKCKRYALKAAEIIQKSPAKNSPNKVSLISLYSELGLAFSRTFCFTKANDYLQRAFSIAKEIAEIDPEQYVDSLIAVQLNLSHLYAEQLKYKPAIELMQQAIILLENLCQENPDRYNPFLSGYYMTLFFYTGNVALYEKAVTLTNQYPEHPYCRRAILLSKPFFRSFFRFMPRFILCLLYRLLFPLFSLLISWTTPVEDM